MNKVVDRLRQRRERVEEQARTLRDQEIKIRTNKRLRQDAEYKSLEQNARKARRTLQLNRLGQAQKRRSIKAMHEKIAAAEEVIRRLRDAEPLLDESRANAHHNLDKYRRRIEEEIAATLT